MRKADNLPPSCAVVTKSGNLNFLENSGPVQVCNGTALPFLLDGVGGHRHAPAALPPGKETGILCIGGWVDPRAGMDRYGKSRPRRDSIPGPSSP